MGHQTGISLYEKIEIETTEEILPTEFAELILGITYLYNLYLFFFAMERADEDNSDLIWSKNFIDAKDAAYPEYQTSDQLDEFREKADNILYAFNEARAIEHYEDIIGVVPNKLKLQINKLTSNSPVKIELLGLGEVIKEFKEFLLAFINLKLDRQHKKQDLRKKELENFEKVLELSVKYKLTPEMVGKGSLEFAKATNTLDRLLDNNKIGTFKIEEENN